jgi:hypothetical protein
VINIGALVTEFLPGVVGGPIRTQGTPEIRLSSFCSAIGKFGRLRVMVESDNSDRGYMHNC